MIASLSSAMLLFEKQFILTIAITQVVDNTIACWKSACYIVRKFVGALSVDNFLA